MHKTMEVIYVSEQTKDAGFSLEINNFIFKNHILVSIDGTAERENQADCQTTCKYTQIIVELNFVLCLSTSIG